VLTTFVVLTLAAWLRVEMRMRALAAAVRAVDANRRADCRELTTGLGLLRHDQRVDEERIDALTCEGRGQAGHPVGWDGTPFGLN
jgi:hypothetical protein